MKRDSRIFLGKAYDAFKEAFPQVKSIQLEYTEHGHLGTLKPCVSEKHFLTEKTISGVIRCSNPSCQDGGYEIDLRLAIDVFHKKKKEQTGIISCGGYTKKGKRAGRNCPNFIEYKATVEYK